MKRARRLLYLIVMAVVVAAIAVFASACGDNREQPATKYTLTFMNGNAPYYTITGTADSDVVFEGEEPTKTNLVFDGWSETEGGEVVELPAKMPAENKTYYAVFSVRYTLTFNVGSVGSLTETTKAVKAGASLYEVVSGVVPTASGDATFDAWYYGNSKVDAQSSAVMPESDIVLDAKYYVDYVVNVYKQTVYHDTTAEGYGDVVQISDKGYVGEWVVITPDEGYTHYTEKDDKLITSPLSVDKANNTYNVYFNYRDYKITFNSNLPSDVKVSGKMDDVITGYAQEYEVPECNFTAAGYRFMGWATSATGKVEYHSGDDFDATRNTNFYAVWAKSLTDSKGQSSDYVYICDNADGTDVVAYLERIGIEVEGTYDEATGKFVVENAAGNVIVRGIADIEAGTYTYLATEGNVYVLGNMFGAVNQTVTLELDDSSDTATFTVDGNDITGKYSYSVENGSLMFVGEDVEFAFRLKTFESESGDDVQAFVMRGEEAGEWYRIESDGTNKGYYYLSLDGFGGAKLYCKDDESSSSEIWTALDGIYEVNEEYDLDGIEISVIIIGNNVSAFECLLLEGETNIYIEKVLAQTFVSENSNDTLTLDGYGIYDNSAVYTHGEVTVECGYVYDDYMGAVTLFDEEGKPVYAFELNRKVDPENDKQYIYTFEPVNDLFGAWLVAGLNNNAFLKGYVLFEVYNNGYADFAVLLPLTSNYYGNSYMDYFVVLSGTYENIEGTDEYVFNGNADKYADAVYNFYNRYGITLDISRWGDFKFKPYYDGDEIVFFQFVAFGDGMGGETLSYEGVNYTLDGYGNAVGDDEGNSVKKYTASTAMGVKRVWLTVTEDSKQVNKMFVYVDDGFRLALGVYSSRGARSSLAMYLLEGNYAWLLHYNPSADELVAFSWGKIVWNESAGADYATYTEGVGVNSMYVPFEVEYDNFKFRVDKSNGLFIIYTGDSLSSDTGVSTITLGGATLTIDTVNAQATYTKADDTSYSGTYEVYDDVVIIYYPVTAEDGTNDTASISVKITDSSFVELSLPAGHWINSLDGSYIVLDGIGSAEYYAYDDDNDNFVKIIGTYAESASNRYANEYTFTSTGEDGITFDFRVGYNNSNMPIFMIYQSAGANGAASYLVLNSTLDSAVGQVIGGYNFVQLTVGNSAIYYGSIEQVSGNIYAFYAEIYQDVEGMWYSDRVIYLMFNRESSGMEYYIRLNDFYSANNGIYNLDQPLVLGQNVIEKLFFPGYQNIVWLMLDDTRGFKLNFSYDEDNDAYFVYEVNDGEATILCFFRVYDNYYDEQYVAVIDDGLMGEFINVGDFTCIYLNGFGNAVYIDAYGVYHAAKYEWVDGDVIICITYMDEYYNVYELYIQIDLENNTYQKVAPPTEDQE